MSEITRRHLLGIAGAVAFGGCLDTDRTPELSPESWPMAGGDPGRTHYAPGASPPRDEPSVAWEEDLGLADGQSPIVADGTLYYQTVDELFVLDPETGSGKGVDTSVEFRGSGAPAFAPSRPYRDGVYLVPYVDEVVAYPAAPSTWPGEIPGSGERRMRWSTLRTGPTTGQHPAGWSSDGTRPIPVDGVVVYGSGQDGDAHVSAVDVDDGSRVWKQSVGEPYGKPYRIRRSTTVVEPDHGTVVTSLRRGIDYEGGLVAHRLDDGSHRWTVELGDAHDVLAVSDGTAYVSFEAEVDAGEVTLCAIGLDEGDVLWRQKMGDEREWGIAVDDRHCYHLGVTGKEGRQLHLTAVDRMDGSASWSRRLGFWGLYNPRNPTVGGSTVLAPGEEAIHAFDSETGDILWTFSRRMNDGAGRPRAPRSAVVPIGNRLVTAMSQKLFGLTSP